MSPSRSIGLFTTLAITLGALAATEESAPPETAPLKEPQAPVEAFLDRANREFDRSDREQGAAVYVNATFLNEDTDLLASRASARDAELRLRMAEEALAYGSPDLTPRQRRDLSLIGRVEYMPERMALPVDPALREEMITIQRSMASSFSTGRYCPDDEASCKTLGELYDVIQFHRDPDALLDAWLGWRTVSAGMREDYHRFAELSRQGAHDAGFSDMGEMWRDAYDMPPDDLARQADQIWQQVRPLYEQLHCYARHRLADRYGEELVPQDGPIPAHLLGDMWAQRWDGIYDLLEPYQGVVDLDVSAALEAQDYDSIRIARAGERFFTSLGLPPLPESFWEHSMLSKPRDRDVVCRATAWNMNPAENDVRITQCIQPTEEHFVDIHHELGHIYYFMSYRHLPNMYRRGANGAFHEGIGDAVNLSLTPGYYRSIGLIPDAADSRQAMINRLLKLALDRVAFLPFGLILDKWRWGVLAGDIPTERYNESWWELRVAEQGIAAPAPRTERDFDPAAKYHVPANVPYIRYFFARILQFQLHRAMCEAAGWEGRLQDCSVYGSEVAGRLLWGMLQEGASRPWQDTLQEAIGARDFDASAMLDYFAPLSRWLAEENAGRQCGW